MIINFTDGAAYVRWPMQWTGVFVIFCLLSLYISADHPTLIRGPYVVKCSVWVLLSVKESWHQVLPLLATTDICNCWLDASCWQLLLYDDTMGIHIMLLEDKTSSSPLLSSSAFPSLDIVRDTEIWALGFPFYCFFGLIPLEYVKVVSQSNLVFGEQNTPFSRAAENIANISFTTATARTCIQYAVQVFLIPPEQFFSLRPKGFPILTDSFQNCGRPVSKSCS